METNVIAHTRICEVRSKLASSEGLSAQTARRFDEVAGRFEAFLKRGFDIEEIADVTPSHVEAFVIAKAQCTEPAIATMHMRRTVLRLLFRIARTEFGLISDPSLDLILPPRSTIVARPLTDDEIALGRSFSTHNLGATRHPAAWALGEATATTAELGHITIDDLDLTNSRVWIHGGTKRTDRWGYVTDWGIKQLERRARTLTGTGHLIYQASGSGESRQASCSNAIKETLTRAGLDKEPDVRPPSLPAWAGRRILEETSSIEEVARRLGIASLDTAARFISHDWHK